MWLPFSELEQLKMTSVIGFGMSKVSGPVNEVNPLLGSNLIMWQWLTSLWLIG